MMIRYCIEKKEAAILLHDIAQALGETSFVYQNGSGYKEGRVFDCNDYISEIVPVVCEAFDSKFS